MGTGVGEAMLIGAAVGATAGGAGAAIGTYLSAGKRDDRKKAKAASSMGLRVQAYNQSTANFWLSEMKKGAPNPFKARFATTSKKASPVIITKNKPILSGTGSAQTDQS